MKETDAGTATRRTGPRSSAAPPGGKERARRSRSRKVARNGAAARAPWGRPAGSGRAGRRSRIGGTPVKYGDPIIHGMEVELRLPSAITPVRPVTPAATATPVNIAWLLPDPRRSDTS